LKGRSENKPILVLINSMKMLESLVHVIPEKAKILIDTYWPGPLTLIFECHPDLPLAIRRLLTASTDQIGVRYTSHPIVRDIISLCGGPITSTSANLAGDVRKLSRQDIIRTFSGKIPLFIDGGEIENQIPSTLVRVVGKEVELVREGLIPFSAIAGVMHR
jgi:L-threonylcarbamoyladenylate synthase